MRLRDFPSVCVFALVLAAGGCDRSEIAKRAEDIRERNAANERVCIPLAVRKVRGHFLIRGNDWFGYMEDGTRLRLESPKVTAEYINPPINLTISQIAAQTYRLSFYSDNREGGFAGYGIFTAASSESVAAYPSNDLSSAAAFCSNSGQVNYKTTVTIEVGPAAAGGSICNITELVLTPGHFVGLRGRVERLEEPWSEAAIAQVP